MALTPLDIHNKEFKRAFRGYHEDEVNEFLDQVIKEFEALIRENKRYEDENSELREKLERFNNLEETLSKSIVIAQDTAEEVKANARKEAQLIVREAEKNADRIVNEALMKSREISLEIDDLKKRAAIYRTRFRTLLEAQLEMLGGDDWELFDDDGLQLSENA